MNKTINKKYFNKNSAKNNEQKLVCELVDNLRDVEKAFYKMSLSSLDIQRIAEIMLSGTISHAISVVYKFCNCLEAKKEKIEFLKEIRENFLGHIEDLLESVDS